MSEGTGQTDLNAVNALLQPHPCSALFPPQTLPTLLADKEQTPDCFSSEIKADPLENNSSSTVCKYKITSIAESHDSNASADSESEFKDCIDFDDKSAFFVNKSAKEGVQTLNLLHESVTNMGNQSSSKPTDSPGQESETATCCQVKPRKLRKRSTSVENSEPRAATTERDGLVDNAGEIKHNYIVLDAKARIRLSADFDVITPEDDDNEKKETEKSFELASDTVPGPRIPSDEKTVARDEIKATCTGQDKGGESMLQEQETEQKHVTDDYAFDKTENRDEEPRATKHARANEKKGDYRFKKRGFEPEEVKHSKLEIQERQNDDSDLYTDVNKGDKKTQMKQQKDNLHLKNLEMYSQADAHSSSEGYVTPELDMPSLTRQDFQTSKTSSLGSRGKTSPIASEFKDVEDSGNVSELLIPDDTVVDTDEHMLIDVNQIISDFKKIHDHHQEKNVDIDEFNTTHMLNEKHFELDKRPTFAVNKTASSSAPQDEKEDKGEQPGFVSQMKNKKSVDILKTSMPISTQDEVQATSPHGQTSVIDKDSGSAHSLQSSETVDDDYLHDSDKCVIAPVKRLIEIASERLAKNTNCSSRKPDPIAPDRDEGISDDQNVGILPPADFQDTLHGFGGKDADACSDDMLYKSGTTTEEAVQLSNETLNSSISDTKQSELHSSNKTNKGASINGNFQTHEIQQTCQKNDSGSLNVPNHLPGSITPVEEHVPPPSPSAFEIVEEDEDDDECEISTEDKRKSEEIVEFGTDVCKRLSQLLDEECIFVDSESDEEMLITDTSNVYIMNASSTSQVKYQQEAHHDMQKTETYVKDTMDEQNCVSSNAPDFTADGNLHLKSKGDVAKGLALRRQQLTRSSTTDSTDSIEKELKAIYQPKEQGSLPKRDSEILCDVLDAYTDDHADADEHAHNVDAKKQNAEPGTKPKILKIPTLEETWPGTSPPQILDEIQDRTPTMEAHPERTPLPELACADVSTAVCQTSGRRSVTRTESDLDLSEQRTDHSTDSMLADDEYEETMEILFSKTYTEPAEGGEAFVSCTVVNSSFKEPSQEDLWMKYASEEALKLLEGSAADVMSSAFVKAKKEMQDIHEHLVSLKHQMEHFHEDLENRHCTDVDYLSPDYSSGRRAITD